MGNPAERAHSKAATGRPTEVADCGVRRAGLQLAGKAAGGELGGVAAGGESSPTFLYRYIN